MDYTKIPTQEILKKTVKNLAANGITGVIVENKEQAKNKVLELIPKDSEVMSMSSTTLQQTGIDKEIEEGGNYNSVRKKLYAMDRKTQSGEMQKLGAAPNWTVGSVHAVTQDGKVMIASNTGSQLPAYAYASSHVIWVVGAQKIVKDFAEGLKRIYEYVLPLESERVKKAYGMEKSNVSKLLIINKEVSPNRLRLILVKEVLGF